MANEEHLRELEEKYEGYTVYDNQGSKIGKVDDLFVDESDNEEYIGVKMGFLGTKSTLIPTDVVRVNEQDRSIEVSESKDHVKDAPSFSDDDDITADYEERIRSHFGLGTTGSSGRGSYGGESSGETATGGAAGAAATGTTANDSEHESSGYGTSSDESSGVDTGYDERSSSTTGSDSGTGEYGDRTSSSDQETYRDETTATGAGETAEQGQPQRTTGPGTPTGEQQTGSADAPGEGTSTTGRPSTSRQTEETETFQEGGRTKIRRRTIIEEVVDADEQ